MAPLPPPISVLHFPQLFSVTIVVAVTIINCLERAEQPMTFAVGSGGEVKVGGDSGRATRAEGKAAETLNGHLPCSQTFEQPA